MVLFKIRGVFFKELGGGWVAKCEIHHHSDIFSEHVVFSFVFPY